jgi:hypothetical protein
VRLPFRGDSVSKWKSGRQLVERREGGSKRARAHNGRVGEWKKRVSARSVDVSVAPQRAVGWESLFVQCEVPAGDIDSGGRGIVLARRRR